MKWNEHVEKLVAKLPSNINLSKVCSMATSEWSNYCIWSKIAIIGKTQKFFASHTCRPRGCRHHQNLFYSFRGTSIWLWQSVRGIVCQLRSLSSCMISQKYNLTCPITKEFLRAFIGVLERWISAYWPSLLAFRSGVACYSSTMFNLVRFLTWI